jgi:hypothetical protein
MTTPNHPPTADEDVPAVIAVLETLSELADLIHRHRLSLAALKQELASLSDELLVREAQASLAVQAEGKNETERKAKQALMLAADADYQALRRRERELRRDILEREADIERAHVRIRITLAALPLAQAADALDRALDRAEPPGPTPTGPQPEPDPAGEQEGPA